jgi:hypothetical protein
MKVKFFYVIVAAALVFSCAKPPLTEMENAREAVFRAENDEDAVIYAGGTLARARDAVRRMQVEADSKRYDAARTRAEEAIDAAQRAITEGKAGAARARDEAASLLAGLGTAIEDAERNINGAHSSMLDLDYDGLNGDLNAANDTLYLAQADHEQGMYQDAIEKGRDVRSTVGDINQKISNAAGASSPKK